MNCTDFRQALVSDDPAESAELQRHAARCTDCAAVLKADQHLLDAVRAWKEAAPAPPTRLESRIAAALAREACSPPVVLRRRQPRALSPLRWSWVAAAVLLVGMAVLLKVLFLPFGSSGELAKAVREVEQAQHNYALAIVQLEQQATKLLERASDPALTAEQAAILLAYRDRLAHLDAVIVEVNGFLEENPGHSGGHTVLLAAYREKDEVLREVLDLQLGDQS